MAKKRIHTLTNDIVFKMVFLRLPGWIKFLVAYALGIEISSIQSFKITNPELPPPNEMNKFCHLDIAMLIDNQLVDLEVQASPQKNYADRALFYWSRLFGGTLIVGEDYSKLPKTAVISLLDYKMSKGSIFSQRIV